MVPRRLQRAARQPTKFVRFANMNPSAIRLHVPTNSACKRCPLFHFDVPSYVLLLPPCHAGIQRWGHDRVTFRNFPGRPALDVVNAQHVIIDGLELDGESHLLPFHETVTQWFWREWTTGEWPVGYMGVNIDASSHITVQNCIVRDMTQKAVNVQAGRYITIQNNIILNIGHNSLTGGHGVCKTSVGPSAPCLAVIAPSLLLHR